MSSSTRSAGTRYSEVILSEAASPTLHPSAAGWLEPLVPEFPLVKAFENDDFHASLQVMKQHLGDNLRSESEDLVQSG